MRGGQYQVLLLLKGLRERGHESILLARKKGPLSIAATNAGFTVRTAGPSELWQRSVEADIVHAHDARAHAIAAIASRGRFVVSRRVAFPVGRSLVSTWKYERAARFLAVSNFVAMQLRTVGVSEAKIDVVYDGVEVIEDVAAWNSEHPAVAIASYDPQKGRDLIEEAARLAGLRVVFSDNLSGDLRQASMFIYITRSEGLGSAALIAMNVGVPVIASRIEGLNEVFEDGVSGTFVTNDPHEIAGAMRRVVEQPGLAHKLIVGGRNRVRERFTQDHLVARTLLSYERALAA
ncbi:MAG: glycosyltransferase family 4 protein [Acidobacteriaceae bacterium]|nr:glycosyltransferase family 4 protein [Acidobacteriaceae bacterium]MBV9782015.1 glycosyltransferase family 4 protein [Acidobacteriaceae bacterium]